MSHYVLEEIKDEAVREHCAKLNQQMDEWDDRLNRQRDRTKKHPYNDHYWVSRIDGGDIKEVPESVLVNFADNWHYNFGGNVEIRGEKAYVTVYGV